MFLSYVYYGKTTSDFAASLLKHVLHIKVHKRKTESVPVCKNRAVKTYGAVAGDLHALTSALDRSEKSSR
jgi:hypothetical protein